MPDLKKVIDDLKDISKYFFEVYRHENEKEESALALDRSYIIDDAIELLKEQEARVMTLEEVDESRGVNVWAEIHSPHVNRLVLVYCAVRRSETIPKFYNLIEDSGVMWSRTDTDYNADEFFGIRSGWRCWTSRPTEEQRKEAKWE